jgi:hypothetical protein
MARRPVAAVQGQGATTSHQASNRRRAIAVGDSLAGDDEDGDRWLMNNVAAGGIAGSTRYLLQANFA